MTIKGEMLIDIINEIGEEIGKNKLYLSELDGAIGDGDHGVNMDKGFKAVSQKLIKTRKDSISSILKDTGMALVSNVGGASGPLYGTAFIKAASVMEGKSEIGIIDYLTILEACLDGIKLRGKAELDDKTIVDALKPAIDSLKKSLEENESILDCLEKSKNAAYNGAIHTKDIIAKKGRASYLGERSLGHMDPGATSTAIILETIYKKIKNIK